MKKNIILFFILFFILFLTFNAKDPNKKKEPKEKKDKIEQDKKNNIDDKGSSQENKITTNLNLENSEVIFFGKEFLGRPTDKSITINIIPNKNVEVYFEYGKKSREYSNKTKIIESSHLKPIEITIDNLLPDTKYYYRMNYRESGKDKFISSDEHSFYTHRPRGEKFVFTVTADPHLDSKTDPDLYKKVMLSVISKTPDFHIDLGDTFMSDKLIDKNEINIIKRHLELRSFFDLVSHSAPFFLVIGNHEGELGWEYKKDPKGLAFLALKTRKLFYPNPIPDNFYSGNSKPDKELGFHEDYYAWEWGDALFVVLDLYWYTLSKPKNENENWDFTLGKEQYDWLKTTLEKSKAKYKFVFSHQLIGGSKEGRGGVEFAKYFEHGGYNIDGTWGFDKERQGWDKPIHQLMKENNVAIFFHGHDHFFAKQEYEGVIYQLVPQPGNSSYQAPPYAIEYGYKEGTILGNSGYLLITVSITEVTVDFIQIKNKDKNDSELVEQIAYSYTVLPKSK